MSSATDVTVSEDTFDYPIPSPLPPLPERLVAVGKHGPGSVDAEDFSRRVGNWGGASQLIGSRWEALAPGLLQRRLPWVLPVGGGRSMTILAVLALDADPVAGSTLQRAGVSASDLLLVGQMGRSAGAGLLIRAADCKVSLDTADPVQTAPARLQTTFQRIREGFPLVAAALHRQAQALPDTLRALVAQAIEAALEARWQDVLAGEGLFVAPEGGFNRWFLAQLEERRRTGAPLGRLPASGPRRPASETSGPVGPAQLARLMLPAHMEATTATEFLGSLPGWPSATIIAELDGQRLEAVDLSVAERCWRVGIGLRGAVLALRRSLFRPALESTRRDGTPLDFSAMLRQVIARRQPEDSAALVATVAHSIEQRRPLWEREAVVLQAPLSFGAFMTRLGEARRIGARSGNSGAGNGENGTSGAGGATRASGRLLFREVTQRHRRRVLAAAAALYEAGETELAVLDQIQAGLPEWQAASEADASTLIATGT